MNEQAAVEKAVADATLDDFEFNGFLEDWVVIAEVVDEEGDFWLSRRSRPKMPPWRLKALLQRALESLDEEEEEA